MELSPVLLKRVFSEGSLCYCVHRQNAKKAEKLISAIYFVSRYLLVSARAEKIGPK
jgi:hypothetical protein